MSASFQVAYEGGEVVLSDRTFPVMESVQFCGYRKGSRLLLRLMEEYYNPKNPESELANLMVRVEALERRLEGGGAIVKR
jgi:hypothetical protein